MQTIYGRGLGWHRDLPDMRDHTLTTEKVSAVLAKSSVLKKNTKALPRTTWFLYFACGNWHG